MVQKKGEMAGNVFVYVLSIIIVGLILLFGYRSINKVSQGKDEAKLMEFKAIFQRDFEVASSSFGSMKKVAYTLPSSFNEICFVDLANADSATIPSQLIRESVETKAQQNVFILGEGRFETLYIKGLKIPRYPYYSCLTPMSGAISFNIKGELNKEVSILTPPPKGYCQNAQDAQICNVLDSVFGSGYKSDCCSNYGLCC